MRWFQSLSPEEMPGYEFSFAASHSGLDQRTLRTALHSVVATADAMRRIRRERPDIVHVLVGPRGSLMRKARVARCAANVGSRVVVHLHTGDIDRTLMGEPGPDAPQRRVAKLMRSASVVATLWRGPRAGMRTFAPNALWRVMANALPDTPEPDPSAPRDIDVLFAGRIGLEKGAPMLVHIAEALAATGRRISVAGALETDGVEAYEALSAAENVDMLGWLEPDDLKVVLRRSRLLVMPSLAESLPIIALEAMAAGCVVVASPLSALPELLADGRGECVTGGSAEWNSAVLSLLDDPERMARMAKASVRHTRECYGREGVLKQLRSVYAASQLDRLPAAHRAGRVDILGHGVDAVTLDEAVDRALSAVASGRGGECVNANAATLVGLRASHVLRVAFRDPLLSLADGASVVWASRQLKRPLPERVGGIDFAAALMARCAKEGIPVFLLGAHPITLDGAVGWALAQYPELRIAGVRDGYYEDPDEVAATIRDSGARVLIVGMTSPMADGFCVQFAEELQGIVTVVVGGSFEVWAGNVKRAPVWVRHIGMEWFYRLVQEPRRLMWRYASTNTIFVARVFRDALSQMCGRG